MNKKNNIQELLKSIYSLINEAQALQIEYTNNLKINDKSKEDFVQKKEENEFGKFQGFKQNIDRNKSKFSCWKSVNFKSSYKNLYKKTIFSRKNHIIIEKIFIEEFQNWISKNSAFLNDVITKENNRISSK
tara:strand:+ start:528 stop:920 length:393 start_codon:yes stop_codon:yes gene_type:complete